MWIAARIVLMVSLLALAAGCGSKQKKTDDSLNFAEPNELVGQEIESRIEQIPFQHRDELFNNLLWLSQQGEQSIKALVEGLDHESPKVRSNCAWVLGQIADRRTVRFLQPMMQDDNEAVRLEAARSLVRMGDLSAAPRLIEGLDSDKIQVRYGCHEVLKGSTRRDFGYDHLEEDPEMRRVSVLRWRRWWADQANDPWFAKEYATEHGLENVDPTAPAGELEAGTGEWGAPAAPAGETRGSGTGGDTTLDDDPFAEPSGEVRGSDSWGVGTELPSGGNGAGKGENDGFGPVRELETGGFGTEAGTGTNTEAGAGTTGTSTGGTTPPTPGTGGSGR